MTDPKRKSGRPMIDTTTAKRQAALRARRAAEGLAEVRGIYLPPALHPELKKQAVKLGKKSIAKGGV